MGLVKVKNMKQMMLENKRFKKRVEAAQTRSLMRMANMNEQYTKEKVEEVNFTGQMMSKIRVDQKNKMSIRVISDADHAYTIDYGKPGKTGDVTFDEEPGLEDWVNNKLMLVAPKKALYFKFIKAVRIGEANGGQFPFKYDNGLRSMELGFKFAALNSDRILTAEIMKLNM